ncbi:MAG: endolytic transglycosylase MltG [Flavobacteriaceae bacterium]
MIKRRVLVLFSLLFIIAGLYFMIRFYKVFFWSNTKFNNKYSYVFIDRDDNLDSLLNHLQPLLKSLKNFSIAAEKKGFSSKVRSGKYEIRKGMSNNEIVNILRSERLTTKVIFNNQERLENLASRISQQIEADSLELLHAFKDEKFLKLNGFSSKTALAMYLPNTYNLFWDVTPQDFRKRMLEYYNLFWNEERIKRANALELNPIQVHILASIVQKESIRSEEQNKIAGVYLNRLKKNMKLQADPTVIYAIKKKEDNFDKVIRRVLYKDLKLNSPYNTYRFRGLTPGPICMPDLSTIESVLNAESHDYLYFVASSTNPGFHVFSKNLSEHNKNKKLYTKWLDRKKLFR